MPLFCSDCAIHREMGNAKWTWDCSIFQTLLAYNVSLVIYQFGRCCYMKKEYLLELFLLYSLLEAAHENEGYTNPGQGHGI